MQKCGVLFVCLGNICRSPLAEGIFEQMIKEAGHDHIFTDSCGTSAFHIGENPDPRSLSVAEKHGITLQHKGRQLQSSDFEDFQYIIPMDADNLRDTQLVQPQNSASKPTITLMRTFDPTPENGDVPDPYWSGDDGFEQVYQMLTRSCEALLEEVLQAFPK